MAENQAVTEDRVRAAEVSAGLSLATDLAIGVPLEHGLYATLIALRLARSLGLDQETTAQTYYGCLLFYVGCTATAEASVGIFGSEDALTTYATPMRFGSRREMVSGMMRAVAPPDNPLLERAAMLAGSLPKLVRKFRGVVAVNCEVGQLFSEQLGLPASEATLFAYIGERWDGRGEPGQLKGEELPLPMRIIHVARDAAFQLMLGGEKFAAQVIRQRAGGAFDPHIAGMLADEAVEMLAFDAGSSAWETVLASEPNPMFLLEGEEIDAALSAIGDFTDLVSPYMVGHSRGVAALAAGAARRCGLGNSEQVAIRRAGLLHDVGRVAVPVRIWLKAGSLNHDDMERVRLHAYHSERVFARSPSLAELTLIATAHHERLDGSGYHRGTPAAGLSKAARLLAAADVYHAMTEPRPYRPALPADRAAETLKEEVRAGRLDTDAVAAVLDVSGQRVFNLERPVGLTEREAMVLGLLARGLQTKQMARSLGISAKTADRHVQNIYRKIGVSTRAAATLFALQHGLVGWGELPISHPAVRP